jgi:conjugative relaxase-like TrwC/TraI family protein
MVMTIAKITAGDGYTYLTRHTAHGDANVAREADAGRGADAAGYYTAQGNPPGRWTGQGAPLLGLAGRDVTEDQMRALFGHGEHPDSEAIIAAYLTANVRAGMTDRQLETARDAAIAAARLGNPFPAYKPLEKFDARVQARLSVIREETGREPSEAEVKKVKAAEARRSRAAVAGFDLVFSPVKSAALLWALDERAWVRDAIRSAHEAALKEALDLVEEHAAFTRTGHGGIAQVETNGLIAAAFEHWDSRAGDPNLHTHVAVSSKVQGTDGKWRSLDARTLYRMTVAASEVYNTGFEAALSESLGVTFTARPDTAGGREPVREITGVPAPMIEFFSRRRAAIEARYAELVRDYRTQHGHDPDASASHRLARQANLDTRQGKKPPRSLDDKRVGWREELTERFGTGAVDWLMRAVPGSPVAEAPFAAPSAADLSDLAERTVASVSARRSTWTVWNVRAEVERLLRAEVPFLPPERHRELAEAVTALAVSPAHSLSAEAPALLDEPAELRRADGESVFTEHAAGRYTSQAVLDAEARLVNATRTLTAAGLSGPSAAASLDGFEVVARTSLDAGQRDLVTAFASDSRLLLAGIGPAGSGKTTAMRALEYALRAGGQRLVPLATSAASADVLGRELGVRAENLHKFMHEWTRGPSAARLRAGAGVPEQARMFRLFPGDVVLVDEAGMAGTLLLDQLVQLAAARGAVVRLLGDDRQLPAVEGGGALRLVAAAPGTPALSTLYRFHDPGEAAATLQLRTGDASAVNWYHQHGRIRSGSREAMAQAAYTSWKNDMLDGKVTLMAAADGADVTELSAQARADRVTAGQVEPDGARLRDGNLAGAGDWIVTRLNDRRLSAFSGRDWVKNGDAWHVERRHRDGALAVRHLSHGGRVTLPADYVSDQVQLLYATTAHRAQGTTVDTAHPLITAGISREALYVLATRARESTVFYVATHDLPYDEDARVDQVRYDPRQYAAREILLNILTTEGVPLSATETITTAQEEAESLATLVPRYLHAAHEDAAARYRAAAVTALGAAGGRELAADPAWGAVVRRLFDAEDEGWDPAHLLATVAARRELASADSIAEVIAWRIDAFLAGNPGPPQPVDISPAPAPLIGSSMTAPACPAYESAGDARERLTTLAAVTLGGQLAGRARAEAAWPALIAALRRAENAGYDPADALTRTATARELRSARSISEVLAWRINRHLAAHSAAPASAGTTPNDTTIVTANTPLTTTETTAPPDGHDRVPISQVAADGSLAAPLLPWVPGPRQVLADNDAAPLTAYIDDAAALISTRVTDLADTAIRLRHPWTSALGQQPADPDRARKWRRHVSVIAAYRDQHKVTTDDPRQVLGPYTETERAGHRAYWHAAESVLAARRLASLEPANGTSAGDQARAQIAADIYRSLPDHERARIAAAVAAAPGTLWLGDPTVPDEHAATQPGYAPQLIAMLIRESHLTAASDHFPRTQPVPDGEPLEAELARRRRPGQGRPERPHGTSPEPAARSDDGPLQHLPPRHASPTSDRTPHR